ncbi:MAG: hypothetical protein K8I29_14755 [Alphaproteobacteria bacterium]|uniref:PEP-CTERM protein-sorting domain-containing protein n=1 Tax=Candidatus Nitrobium versatile TaxID=2884831 RepID=A0A953M1Y2_9BACT|nr:hypothetical protein [Candidatus Nitrobium versatile]
MKKLLAFVVCLGLIFSAGTASAALYSFEDVIDRWGALNLDSIRITESNPLTYTHDVTDTVNLMAGDTIIEARLELDFKYDVTDAYGEILSIPYDFREYVRVGLDGNSPVELGEVDKGQYDIVLDIDWLNDQGLLDVVVSVYNPLGTGAVRLDDSRLVGTVETVRVPEPSLSLALGMGLAGLTLMGLRGARS